MALAPIASHTVPGTDVLITIEHDPAVKRAGGKGVYYVTRKPNGATFVNYLSCGRFSEAEAREAANFLWTDTVTRRDAKRF